MKNTGKALLLILLLLPAVAALSVRAGESPPADPADYPKMGEKELGQFRWVLKIADQDLGDFSNLEAIDQRGMTSYRYSIAFMTYYLALEKYHRVPAAEGVIGPRMDRLIQKMTMKEVWEFWAEVSKGLRNLEPLMNKPYPERHDPVAEENIMYSGHLGHMIGLYESLYRDMKWDQAGSIVFEWSPDERYLYDNHSLQKVMHEQMATPPYCVPCEPNACFPECNQHPVLSFMLYDQTHGTDLFAVSEKFLDFFLEKKMIDPANHETAALYLVKQDITLRQRDPRFGNAIDLVLVPTVSLGAIKLKSSSANGWTGSMMHAWQPEYIERHYPYQKEYHLVHEDDGSASLKYDVFEPRLQYGYFAMLAAEVGDLEARDKLLQFADNKYDPVWENGSFYYPFNKDKKCTGLTGKLIAIARMLPKDGIWDLHNRPFDDEHFKDPAVAGADYVTASLTRAVYDRDKSALVVTAVLDVEEAKLKLIRLDSDARYTLFIDGDKVREISGRDTATVKLTGKGEHDIVLAKKS